MGNLSQNLQDYQRSDQDSQPWNPAQAFGFISQDRQLRHLTRAAMWYLEGKLSLSIVQTLLKQHCLPSIAAPSLIELVTGGSGM